MKNHYIATEGISKASHVFQLGNHNSNDRFFHVSNNSEQFPGTSSIPDSGLVVDDSHLCCALRQIDWSICDASQYFCLLQQSHELRFKCWVASCRRIDPNIPEKDKLTCPLIDCGQRFEEHWELVNHVSVCSYLEIGEYHCPYHMETEHFVEPTYTKDHGITRKHSTGKRLLDKAIRAIRYLGTKSMRKSIHPSRSSTSSSTRSSSIYAQPTNEDVYTIPEHVAEIDGWETILPKFKETFTAKYDVCGESTGLFEMDGTYTPPVELDGTSPSSSCPSMTWQFSGDGTPESPLSPISPLSPTDRWYQRTHHDQDSPISPRDSAISGSWAIDPSRFSRMQTSSIYEQVPVTSYKSSMISSKSVMKTANDLYVRMMPTTTTAFIVPHLAPNHEATHRDQGFQQYSSMNGIAPDTYIEPEAVRSVETVEDLCHTMQQLVGDTVQKLGRHPVLPYATAVINRIASTEFILDSAFNALKRLLHHEIPTTFFEVFGLAHLAYAAAAIKSDSAGLSTTGLRAIFYDITTWSNAVADTEERIAFTQLAHEIWSPTADAVDANHVDVQPRLSAGQRHNTLILLQKGSAVRYCLQYLNAFQHGSPLPLTAEERYIEAIDRVMDLYHRMSYNIPIANTYNQRLAADAFTDSSFDTPSPLSSAPMSACHSESSVHSNIPSPPLPAVDRFPSGSASSFSGLHDSPRNPTIEPHSAGSSVAENMEHEVMDVDIPETAIPPPAVAATPTSSATEDERGSITCPHRECGRVFRGKVIWLKSNLQRHLRETHSREQKVLTCFFTGCGSTFVRKHNLKVHVETVHHRGKART